VLTQQNHYSTSFLSSSNITDSQLSQLTSLQKINEDDTFWLPGYHVPMGWHWVFGYNNKDIHKCSIHIDI